MKFQAAIFDFDGTLFDSMLLWETVGERYVRGLGKEPKPSLREELRPMSLFQAARHMNAEYHLKRSPEEIIEGIHRIMEDFYFYEVQPKAGVLEFLKRLKQAGAAMCIATATDRCLIEAALKRCGMEQLFSEIFTCSEVGHGKDEPVIYEKAMEFLEAKKDSVVIFEDAYHAVKTAKAAGFFTVAVFDKYEKRQADIRRISDCYLPGFEQTDVFWKLT